MNKQEAVIMKGKKADREILRKLKGNEVSYRSKDAFYGDFGNIAVTKWERGTNFDEATFTKDGQVMEAFYDYNSKLAGTVQNKSFAGLPANAQKFINEKYNNYAAGAVILFDDNELNETDMILFGQQFDDADNYFVELKKAETKIIVQVNMSGDISYFTRIK